MITKVNIKGEFETLKTSIEQQPIARSDILFYQLLFNRYVPEKNSTQRKRKHPPALRGSYMLAARWRALFIEMLKSERSCDSCGAACFNHVRNITDR